MKDSRKSDAALLGHIAEWLSVQDDVLPEEAASADVLCACLLSRLVNGE